MLPTHASAGEGVQPVDPPPVEELEDDEEGTTPQDASAVVCKLSFTQAHCPVAHRTAPDQPDALHPPGSELPESPPEDEPEPLEEEPEPPPEDEPPQLPLLGCLAISAPHQLKVTQSLPTQ